MALAVLTLLDGTSVLVNPANVFALLNNPTGLPAGVPDGTRILSIDESDDFVVQGDRGVVAAALAAVDTTLVLVSRTALDGSNVRINAALLVGLTAVPDALLPAGVADGTTCHGPDDHRVPVHVQGDVVATGLAFNTALASSGAFMALGLAAGGFIAALAHPGFTSLVRTGPGVYVATLNLAQPFGALTQVTRRSAGAGSSASDHVAAAASTFGIRTFDGAGAAADSDYAVVVWPLPSP